MIHLDVSILNEYLDSALPAAQCVEVESHLASCAECAARLASLRALFASLESLPDLPLDRDLSSAVINAVQRLAPRPTLAPAIRLVFALQAIFALIALAITIPFAIALFPAETVAQLTGQAFTDLAQLVESLSTQWSTTLTTLETTFTNLTTTRDPSLPTLPMYTVLATLAAATLLFIVGNGVLLLPNLRMERR